MGLGQKIRDLRDQMGMSQAQLASSAGVSQGYLSQIENEEVQNPSAAVLFRLAKAMHVDPRSLLQAAGLTDIFPNGDEEDFQAAVDPDLLRFLSRLSQTQQRHLLQLLKGMEERTRDGKGVREEEVQEV